MKRLTPIKAIRAKCLDCMCGQSHEVKLCAIKDCSLFPYRFGRNPYLKREYTEEQLADMRDRLKRPILAEIPQQTQGENELNAQGVYKGTPENDAKKTPTAYRENQAQK